MKQFFYFQKHCYLIQCPKYIYNKKNIQNTKKKKNITEPLKCNKVLVYMPSHCIFIDGMEEKGETRNHSNHFIT